MRILWAVLIVGGCGVLGPAAPPRDPAVVAAERACAPVVNADPAVRAYVMKGAGSEIYKLEHEESLAAARARALRGCLGGGGGAEPGGGVERQRRG